MIPTDEELVITEDTYTLEEGTYDTHANFTYSFQHRDYHKPEREANLAKDIVKWEGLDRILAKPV